MDQAEFRARRNYAKELNIRFLGPAPSRQWPDVHRRLFEDIQKLGDQRYSSFSETVSVDSIEKPWRCQTKQRAARLVQQSRISREERKNEAGWRFSIEPEVLYRFTVEVTCPRCRSRLWKSEIEAAVQSSQTFAQSLQARRRRREPCRCVNQWGYNGGYESGVNMLFSDRAQAAIKHDPPLPIDSRRRGQVSEEPDRIYGLRDIGGLKKALDSRSKHRAVDGEVKPLRDTIEVSPFDDEGEQLLFPFLIMEAKSGKHGDTAAVEMQTGFCIRRLLRLQLELQNAEVGGSIEWVIVNLWSGDLTSEDGSLQLLLIVDYIFDWARDVYRQSLLARLSSLSMEYLPGSDPDILSTIERCSTAFTSHPNDSDNSPDQIVPLSVPSIGDYLNLIHAEGVVRDASVIESKFMAVYITEHDIDSFRLSFASEEEYREKMMDISSLLEQSWRWVPDTLYDIEQAWTGTPSSATSSQAPDGSAFLFVRIALRMFIASDWQPVRQLVCLAISSRAVAQLWGNDRLSVLSRNPFCTTRQMEKFLRFMKSSSTVDTLAAAISMQCLTSASRKRKGRFAPQFKRSGPECVLRLILSVIESHTIGRRLSPDTYLRSSRMQTKQSVHTEGPKLWPHLEQLSLHPNGTLLVDCEKQVPGIPRRCLYIVDGSYEASDVVQLVGRMSCEGAYYSAIPLPLSDHRAEYLAYINRPIDHSRYWKTQERRKGLHSWISALEELVSAGSNLQGSSSFPILLSSSDEVSDNDEDDDAAAENEITVAWKDDI